MKSWLDMNSHLENDMYNLKSAILEKFGDNFYVDINHSYSLNLSGLQNIIVDIYSSETQVQFEYVESGFRNLQKSKVIGIDDESELDSDDIVKELLLFQARTNLQIVYKNEIARFQYLDAKKESASLENLELAEHENLKKIIDLCYFTSP